jgi:hypothetical protein
MNCRHIILITALFASITAKADEPKDSLKVPEATIDSLKADTVDKNKPVFTTIMELPITSIKDQNRSGTCWDYSALSFFESELLRTNKKEYDLSEVFVANKNYMDRAILKVRMHGDAQFAQGGSAYDVLYVLKNYGGRKDLKFIYDTINGKNDANEILADMILEQAKSLAFMQEKKEEK